MKVVGLTGGMGSGKTTVAGFFKELGVPVYIADDAAKDLMVTSPTVKTSIVKLLGPLAYERHIPNRKFIASKVFGDPLKLEALNGIIHPAVAKDFEQWKTKQTYPYIIYEAAILFESGGYKKCDAVILVSAPLEKRFERLQKRDQSSIEEIEARMLHQWSDEEKRNLANFEIINSELSFTQEQVKNLHEFLLKPSKN